MNASLRITISWNSINDSRVDHWIIGFVCCVRGDKASIAGFISSTAFAGCCTTQAGAFVGRYHAPVLDMICHELLAIFQLEDINRNLVNGI